MTSIRVALESVSKAFVRPKWTPPLDLKYTLRDIDPAVVTPSGWIPPQGLQEVLPFHVSIEKQRAASNSLVRRSKLT